MFLWDWRFQPPLWMAALHPVLLQSRLGKHSSQMQWRQNSQQYLSRKLHQLMDHSRRHLTPCRPRRRMSVQVKALPMALHLEARRTETEPVQRILYRMCRDLRTRMRQILLKCRRHRKRLLICGPVNPAPFLNGRNGSRHQTADSGSIKRKL
ncbi:unknown [Ruminococcus sp. CAG:60]|nr:unknown [Ruminococcus sp. CAG:60]